MTIYDDLRKAYASYSDEQSEYWGSTARYAYKFAEGFREYLGAPVDYETSSKERKPYVELVKVFPGPDGHDQSESASIYEALSRLPDGQFTFGVRIMFERAANTFPKAGFLFSINLFPKGSVGSLRVAGTTFQLDLQSDAARADIYAHMIENIDRWLTSKPWEVDRRPQIGFIDHDL